MPPIATDRQPFTEPWTSTALRTGGLALLVAAAATAVSRRIALFAPVFVFALWFTLGGHFLELLFRNALAPRLANRARAPARLLYWFMAGALLYAGAGATWRAMGWRPIHWPWWAGGAGFIAAELLVHAGLRARRQPSFFDGRG